MFQVEAPAEEAKPEESEENKDEEKKDEESEEKEKEPTVSVMVLSRSSLPCLPYKGNNKQLPNQIKGGFVMAILIKNDLNCYEHLQFEMYVL